MHCFVKFDKANWYITETLISIFFNSKMIKTITAYTLWWNTSGWLVDSTEYLDFFLIRGTKNILLFIFFTLKIAEHVHTLLFIYLGLGYWNIRRTVNGHIILVMTCHVRCPLIMLFINMFSKLYLPPFESRTIMTNSSDNLTLITPPSVFKHTITLKWYKNKRFMYISLIRSMSIYLHVYHKSKLKTPET